MVKDKKLRLAERNIQAGKMLKKNKLKNIKILKTIFRLLLKIL